MDQNNEPHRVEFETDSWQAVKYYRETTAPKIIQKVMKYSGGYIKDEKQASYVVLGFVALAIIISLFLFFGDSSSNDERVIPSIPAAEVVNPNFFRP